MFLTCVVFILSVGAINVANTEECKDVKMKMSHTKDGRIELDVDQFCSCAGYTKSRTTDAPDLSRWKPPATTEVTEKYIAGTVTDKSSTATEKSFINTTSESTTEKSAVDKAIDKRSTDKIIDKMSRGTTTESVTYIVTGKRSEGKLKHRGSTDTFSEKNSTTTYASTVIPIIDKSDIDKNITTKSDTDLITKTSTVRKVIDKSSTDKVANESSAGVMTETPTVIVTEKITADKVLDKNSTDKVTDKSSADATTESVINVTTSIADKFRDETSTDKVAITTEQSTLSKIIDKSSKDKLGTSTAENFTADLTVTVTENTTADKSSIENGTETSILIDVRMMDIGTDVKTTENVFDKSITEKGITDGGVMDEVSEEITAKAITIPIVTDDGSEKTEASATGTTYKMEMTSSSDAAHQTSDKNEKKIDSEKNVFFIFLAIIGLAAIIAAISCLVYTRCRSNSYVLPPHHEVTALNTRSIS